MLLSLLSDFVTISHDHLRLAENVPAKRATTRRLLFGRPQRAKEMIEVSALGADNHYCPQGVL
jgi:hypothetical protein